MNSILNNQRWNNQLQNQQYRPSFNEFASWMTPEKAKMQVESMLQNGQLTQQQFENAKNIVNSILSK